MTAGRDQHGLTADDLADQLARLGDDETHERLDPPTTEEN